jgi:hypothetical protein
MDFLNKHGSRFRSLEHPDAPNTHDCAGYVRDTDKGRTFYILKGAFQKDICAKPASITIIQLTCSPPMGFLRRRTTQAHASGTPGEDEGAARLQDHHQGGGERMSSPLAALRSFLSSQPHEATHTDTTDEGAKVATVTPVTSAWIERVTEKSEHIQSCNTCNPCNPHESKDREQTRYETRLETVAIIAEWRDAIVQAKPDKPEIEKLKTTESALLEYSRRN